MANTKISALTSATTPLAGTEVLPVVQSGVTKQVSVANLTAGRAISASSVTNAALTSGRVTYAGTAGLLQDDADLTFDGSTLTTLNSAYTGTLTGGTGVIAIGTNQIYKDASGNVGIGVIPSAWGSTFKPIQLGIGGSIHGRTDSTAVVLGQNNYRDASGNYKYIQTGATGLYQIGSGVHTWSSATSGTAGDTITFITRMSVDASGIVTMPAYGAGAATFSAAGVISSVSDETWKIKDGVPVNPDKMLQKLEPGYWFYNQEKAPIFGEDRQLGFYAQNVNAAIGVEAAPTPEEGKPWGYYDRSVLAVTVMSLKNALSTIEELKSRLTALENK